MTPEIQRNRVAWNERALRRERHTKTVLPQHLRDPLPILDPEGWVEGGLRGKRVLCLAAGGGLHGPLAAAAGADVTVVDVSERMLDLDQQVAREQNLKLRTIAASMDRLDMLAEGSFEVVFQPVSTCYVPDVRAVYRELARLIVPGGLYLSQHKQPVNLQADGVPAGDGYLVRIPYFLETALPPVGECLHRESDAVEYLHRWDQLIGDLCREGFALEDLIEPRHGNSFAPPGDFRHRSQFIPPYVKLKARRRETHAQRAPTLWIPGA